jgi:4-hydroxy-tetrahydrodipicolinate synthase
MYRVFRGYLPIALTPFTEDGDLVWADLEREFDFIARSGSHGVVWPVNDSEFTLLSFPERLQGFSMAVDTVAGRLPVVLGVADTCKAGAVALAEAAAEAGADAVIAMPPWDAKLGTAAQVADYYRAIADAARVPVVIQNLSGPRGSELASQQIADLCRDIPLVQYVKEERFRQAERVSELVALVGEDLKGVFSGGWTLNVVALHRRGTTGNMRGTSVPEVGARIWDLMEVGDEVAARALEERLDVLDRAKLAVQTVQGVKALLVRRGVFTSAAMRNAVPRGLDDGLLHELYYGLDLLAPYLQG